MARTKAPTDTTAPSKKGDSRGRSIASWTLVVIGSILVPLAVVAFWGQRTITDAERYIETVGPLAAEEAIKTAIITRTTETLEDAIAENQGAAQLLDSLPPEAAQKLSAPIQAALNSLVDQVVTRLVYSEQFEQLWIGINERLQEQLVAVLSGDKSVLDLNDQGEVVLDTGEVAAAAKQQLIDRGLTFLDDKELPAGADQQIVLLKAEELKQAQLIYSITVPAMRFLIPLVGLIFLGAVALSNRRARTVMGIGIGVVIGMSILAFALTFARTALDSAAPSSIAQNALNAFYVTLTRYLSTSATTWITGGVIVALLGWFGGRSAPATALRASVGSSLKRAGGQLSSAPLSTFFAEHWRASFIGIGALAVVVMMLFDPVTAGVLVWISLLALAAAALVIVLGAAGSQQSSGSGEASAGGNPPAPENTPTAPATNA